MLYFAYGSNLDREAMAVRCRDSKPICVAELIGYRIVFRGYKYGYADIIKQKGSKVVGALYEVSKKDLKALDEYEGVSDGLYERVNVFVKSKNGNLERAIVYKMVNVASVCLPTREYYEIVRNGRKQWGLSTRDTWNDLIYTFSLLYN